MFVTLDSEIPEVPDEVAPIRRTSIRVPLAACRETERLTQLHCYMEFDYDETGPFYEFAFEIEVVSIDETREDFATMDRTVAAPYIPDDCRPQVMPIVIRCLLVLIEAVQPLVIYRVSKLRINSQAAMQKHMLITAALEGEGFGVTDTGLDEHGRTFWLMSLPEALPR